MTRAKLGGIAALTACLWMGAAAHAQQAAATAPAAEPAPGDDAAKAPSEEMLKKARIAGYKPEKRKGVIQFCIEDADIGTHFKTKKCYDENRLALILQQQQLQREQLQHMACAGGGACGGNK